jgi:hypothetical protein
VRRTLIELVRGAASLNASELLEKAATLRDMAKRALRLADGLAGPDHDRLYKHGADLRAQATELERQAATETQPRPAEETAGDGQQDRSKQNKGRGGSNDPDPQV